MTKKILFVSDGGVLNIVYKQTVQKLTETTNAHFDCLVTSDVDDNMLTSLRETFNQVYTNDYSKSLLSRFPKLKVISMLAGLHKCINGIGQYDIIHLHFHHYYYSYFIKSLKKKASKVYVSFLGCDFNMVSRLWHWHNQKTVNMVDGIFAENETFLNNIFERYGITSGEKRLGTLIPYKKVYESFKYFLEVNTNASTKAMWGFGKKTIVCGYNAARIARHEVMIDALSVIGEKLEDFKVLFPMAYAGSEDFKAKIEERLNASPFDGIVLYEFLSGERLMSLRLAADIFVHIAVRDQMAHSFLEHLAAGCVVITGDWLPYHDLIKKGIYFVSIPSLSALSPALQEVINNLAAHKEKAKYNRKIILEMMAWESVKRNWLYQYGLSEMQQPVLKQEVQDYKF